MPSPEQYAANKLNALLSTGPRTAEGKQTVALNSLRHGLTSRRVVLPGESESDYEALLNELMKEHDPRTPEETTLVNQIAEHTWRLLRIRRAETAAFESAIALHPVNDPDEAIAEALTPRHSVFENIRRYEAATERAFYRAMAKLAELKALRPQIGFASQNAPARPEELPGQALEHGPCDRSGVRAAASAGNEDNDHVPRLNGGSPAGEPSGPSGTARLARDVSAGHAGEPSRSLGDGRSHPIEDPGGHGLCEPDVRRGEFLRTDLDSPLPDGLQQ